MPLDAGRRLGAFEILEPVGYLLNRLKADHPGRALEAVGFAEYLLQQVRSSRLLLKEQERRVELLEMLFALGLEDGEYFLEFLGVETHQPSRVLSPLPGTRSSKSRARSRYSRWISVSRT